MKKLFSYIPVLILLLYGACTDDTLQDMMDREQNYVHLETVTSDSSTNVYFKISDSGTSHRSEDPFGADGSYINIPAEMEFTVYDNVYDTHDVVVDNVSKLMWTKCTLDADGSFNTNDDCGDVGATPKVTQSTAVSHCEDLSYGGYSDWRLPSAPELFSIVNFSNGNPAIDTTVFPGIPSPYTYSDPFWGNLTVIFYWTRDTGTVFGTDFSNWVGSFDTNDDFSSLRMVDNAADTEEAYVRCVRGP